ncbi:POLR2A [Symbiodinium sp. CCMP2592]|nr:POLR2A [Symbiodinium sp. CCMP2592]
MKKAEQVPEGREGKTTLQAMPGQKLRQPPPDLHAASVNHFIGTLTPVMLLLDDVTSKLGDIIKVNNMLKTQVENGAGEHIIADFVKLLQYHIFTLCDNTIVGIPQAGPPT